MIETLACRRSVAVALRLPPATFGALPPGTRFPCPTVLALAAGVQVRESWAVDSVSWSDDLVLFRKHDNQRTTGMMIHLGLAGALLRRRGLPFTIDEQWRLAVERCAPTWALCLGGISAVVEAQVFAPGWLIRAAGRSVGASR